MRLIVTLLLALMAGPLAAQCNGPSFFEQLTPDEVAALDAAVAETPFAEGLIFEALRGDQQITLVGTIHIHDPRLSDIAAQVAPAIKAADILLVEASRADAAQLENHLAANPQLLFLTDGPTLPDMLEEPTWQALADAARDRQIPPFMAAKMQPWFLSISLAIAPCAMAEMAAGKPGLDFMLMDIAQEAGVATRSLEPWITVIDLMRDAPMDEQIANLELGMLPTDLHAALFVAMMDSYLDGQAMRVWEASRLALNYVPGLDPAVGQALFAETEAALLVGRNHNWMPVIAEAMTQADRAVVAVGAAHLPGHEGLLQLLANDGWQITRR